MFKMKKTFFVCIFLALFSSFVFAQEFEIKKYDINARVNIEARSIEVTTKDNRRLKAKLIGRDPDTEVALTELPVKLTAPSTITVPLDAIAPPEPDEVVNEAV